MTAYISVSFNKRAALGDVINVIIATLQQFNIASLVFVDQYKFDPSQEKQMMQQAMRAIDKSDLLIAETSYKAIGVGVEAGYAKAKGKRVFYLRQAGCEHSTTVAGISDVQIVYMNCNDLEKQLVDNFRSLNKNFI